MPFITAETVDLLRHQDQIPSEKQITVIKSEFMEINTHQFPLGEFIAKFTGVNFMADTK